MKCKHEWQVMEINPYLDLPLEDQWGVKAEFVCICLKCNKFKTIDAERILEQTKGFTYNEGCKPPDTSHNAPKEKQE